ncbi:MAG: hypothetical protein RLZZ383_2857 [Pseudomonadota bacterium]|jgi:formamidopyrimidine-DNA glycosylase
MPELPEVEIARRNLSRWTAGRRVETVWLVDPAVARPRLSTAPRDADPALADRLVRATGSVGLWRRHGKRLAGDVGGTTFLCHFGMTGRWVRRRRDDPPSSRSVRLGLGLDDGHGVWFLDERRFGAVTPTDDVDAGLKRGHGPDCWDDLSEAALAHALAGGRTPLKPALMDQARLAGLGNIHAAEACWRAGLSPYTPCGEVVEIAKLAEAIHVQLRFALDVTAADDVVYLSDGGGVDNPFAVYGRHGQPCPRCGEAVRREVQAGRSTYGCATCQPGGWPRNGSTRRDSANGIG